MTETSPDLVQPVLGYRSWSVAAGRLRSNGLGDYEWKPGVNEASCRGVDLAAPWRGSIFAAPAIDGHRAPKRECGCGFYALSDVPYTMGTHTGGPAIVGAIAAWGRIEVHRDGFRAEKAQVVVLGIPDAAVNDPDRRELIERLAQSYGCRAVPMCDLRDAAREHGIEMPEELLPEVPEPSGDDDVPLFANGGHVQVHMSGPSHFAQLAQQMNQTLRAFGPKPTKKNPSWLQRLATQQALYWGSLASMLTWGGMSDWSVWWQIFIATVALAVPSVVLAVPLYRLALRVRCEWRDFSISQRVYHGNSYYAERNRRVDHLVPGDRCPECGWRLK